MDFLLFCKVRGPAVRHALEMSSNIARLECSWIYPSDVLVWLIVLEKSICELWLWLGLGILARFMQFFITTCFFPLLWLLWTVQVHKNIFFASWGLVHCRSSKLGDFAGESHDGAQIGAINFFNKLGERHKNKPGEFQYETREKKNASEGENTKKHNKQKTIRRSKKNKLWGDMLVA